MLRLCLVLLPFSHKNASYFLMVFSCLVGYLPALSAGRDEVAPRPSRRIGQQLWKAPLQDMGGQTLEPRKTTTVGSLRVLGFFGPERFCWTFDDFVWSLVLFFCSFFASCFDILDTSGRFRGPYVSDPFSLISTYQQTKLKLESGRCNSDCIVWWISMPTKAWVAGCDSRLHLQYSSVSTQNVYSDSRMLCGQWM